jgi:hypothetical protein
MKFSDHQAGIAGGKLRSGQRVQQRWKLEEQKDMLRRGAADPQRRTDMGRLEADHQVGLDEAPAPQRARPVSSEVDASLSAHLDGGR